MRKAREGGGWGGWRTKRKGSYPPGSNTCHQLLPPSCAFIKKPPSAPRGNPHALLKKCEVNTVCLSVSLPPPSLPCHLFSSAAPSFYLSMMCSAGQWRGVHSLHVSVCVSVCVCACVRVCVYLYVRPWSLSDSQRFQHSAQSQGKHCQRECLQCRAPSKLDAGRISTPHGRHSSQQPTC